MPILTLKTKEKSIEIPFSGNPLLSAVLKEANLFFPSPCGGNGKCGKCAVDVFGEISKPTEREVHLGKRLACKTVLLGDATVIMPESYNENAVVETQIGDFIVENSDLNYGAVIDLGTTTLALKLFSGKGEVLAEATALNPQRTISADIIGRISASINGKSGYLQAVVAETINKMVENACSAANINPCQIDKTVVVGNTSMLYFLCGENPKSISVAPFSADNLFDKEITNPVKAYLPPCINAFVGADLVCAVLASGMCEKNETALLCDIGTNGEIALRKNGKLFVTSAAAGPAFEGTEMSCGCQSIDGAIDKVWAEEGNVVIHTVNGKEAVGLCGSGMVDAVATFLELGYIDASGAIPTDLKLPAKGKNIYITKKDIRALQVAKSAIRSAIETLLDKTDTDINTVETLYLCGGFGNKLNLNSAVRIGLVPDELKNKVCQIGNGALMGGAMILFAPDYKEKAIAVANNATHIELGGNQDFNKRFINNIGF